MVNVTGHAKKLDGSPLDGSSCVVRFQLTFTGPNVPRIPGVTALPQTFIEVEPDSVDGSFAVEIYGNDEISCNGVVGNTRWRVTYVVDNAESPAQLYDITGTGFDLDEAAPIDGTPPPDAPSLPPFVIVVNFPTTLSDPSQEIFRMRIGSVAKQLTFPSNFAGSGFSVNPLTLAAQNAAFVVNRIRDGVAEAIGSVIVEAGIASAIFATDEGDQVVFNPTDEFQLLGPVVPDAMLSHFTMTFVAGRT